MKFISCFFLNDCFHILEINILKNYYLEVNYLYPFTDIRFVYFEEDAQFLAGKGIWDTFFVTQELVKPFCYLLKLYHTKYDIDFFKKGINLLKESVNPKCFNKQELDFVVKLSDDILIGDKSSVSQILNKKIELDEILNDIRLSEYMYLFVFQKNDKFCDFTVFKNYNSNFISDVTSQLSINFCRCYSHQCFVDENFNRMNDREKISRFHVMINGAEKTIYDEQLKRWWKSRY